jgi:hypothetical protein
MIRHVESSETVLAVLANQRAAALGFSQLGKNERLQLNHRG